uniref:Uncharacterized protein n=1 Tax=Chromera velia CCMP2878 TaxID=1169474 RepID=A0A0G4GDK6_9ALVE|eukprot:Cvel_21419.t1-p1 / transcript=Cvel_21419.t1 / gene=Cvel_21419 / organism=Chromera_velia_CCMP2878 / gene_product=hypothetical protein / transcript_product=hypothetical protein / location=Cvel_scaffold2007:17408-18077(-) / protein_length=133 / sequence_SO=supercontig / SO=protein_coding / is_pseudo=false
MPSFSSSSNQITERQRVQSLILLLPYLKSTDYARLVVCSHSARSAVSVHLRKAIYTFPSLSDSFQTSLDYWCHLWFFFLKTLNLRALDRKKELGLNVLPTDATVATLCAVLRRLDHSMIGQVDLFSPLKPSNL